VFPAYIMHKGCGFDDYLPYKSNTAISTVFHLPLIRALFWCFGRMWRK